MDKETKHTPGDTWANTVKFPSKNWPEDYQQENGCYQNRCLDCGELFMGNKHRSYCKECDIPSPRFWEKLSKKHAPEDNKCAHAGCWADGEMVGFARCMVKEVFPLKEALQKIKMHTRDDSTYQLVNSVLTQPAAYGHDTIALQTELSEMKKEREELKAEIKDLMDGQDQQAVDLVRLIEIIDRAYWHMKYNSPDKKTMAYNEWEACLKIMEPFKILDRLKK